ncbi:MAG: hypothetical protein M3Y13_00310 [Armatimonadota bacterium]|nr:hypothetical protein [Armatimonadota bacterium]
MSVTQSDAETEEAAPGPRPRQTVSVRAFLFGLTCALAVCVFGAVLVSGAASIWLPYTHGGGTALKNAWMYIDAPQLSLSWTASQIQNPHGALTGGLLHMVCGALFVLLMFLCRT